jgi:hypothetical protein
VVLAFCPSNPALCDPTFEQAEREESMGSNNPSADDQSNIQQESRENAKKDGRIAHKIEETIRGFLEFTVAYIRTIGYAVSIRKIWKYPESTRFVRPLTFLCCSFIPYSAILAVSASSIWDFLITPELAVARFMNQLQDISPTKILLTSIPVLISVYAGCSLLAKVVMRGKDRQVAYTYGMCYAFGLQFACTSMIMFMITLGHSRFAEQLIPSKILDVIVWPIAKTGAIFFLAAGAALYPLIAAVSLVASLDRNGDRRLLSKAVSVLGVVAITCATYWLGALPGKFSSLSQPEDKASAAVYPSEVDTDTSNSQAIILHFLVRNPTRRTFVLPADGGLGVNLKITEQGAIFPRNIFHVQLTELQNANPILILKPGDVVWISGTIKPNYDDWGILKGTEATDNQLFIRILLRDQDGETIQGNWEQVKLVGAIPKLK